LMTNLRPGCRELLGEVIRSDLQHHSLPAIVFITPTVPNPCAEEETQLFGGLCVEYSLFPENGDVFANAHRLIVSLEGKVEPVVASSFFKSATPRNPFASTSLRTNS